jgi:NADH-quinone oxidoreductase subunit G
MSTGQGETRFSGVKRQFEKPVALSTQVLLDRERCVQCARCTRFSDQVSGDKLIDLAERGPSEQVATAEASRSAPTSPATPCRSAPSAR